MTLLVRFGLMSAAFLRRHHKYAILINFSAAAMLTPDVFSQLLMAGPLVILYEIGILSARIIGKKEKKETGS